MSRGSSPSSQSLEVAGVQSFLPATDITGIHITHDSIAPNLATPRGLLVARAERRAWIRDARGSGDWSSFIVDLGWEPARIGLADLELTHEELLDGELVSSVRLRLEDLDTSDVEALGS